MLSPLRRAGASLLSSSTSSSCRPASTLADFYYDEDQKALMRSARKLVDDEINPHVDEWEKNRIFPAKEVRRNGH